MLSLRLSRLLLGVCAVVAGSLAVPAAHADNYQFTFTVSSETGSVVWTSTSLPSTDASYAATGSLTYCFSVSDCLTNTYTEAYVYPLTSEYSGNSRIGIYAPGNGENNYYFNEDLDSVGTYTSGGDTLVIADLSGPTSATPEPSGLALLGTGLVGVAGMMRRRLLYRV